MRLSFITLFIGLIIFSSCSQQSNFKEYHPLSESPGPSDLDDPLKDSLKQVFLDKLYYAGEGVNVDSIRHQTWQKNYSIKQDRRSRANSRSATEFFANNNIEGTWYERGPNNEAGDIKVIDYVPSLDKFYAISSVGHLWTGTTAGDDWVLLNDDIGFENDFIKVLPHSGGTRIFACYGTGTDDKEIRYSDDEGMTWTKGTGFDFYDHWGAGRRLYALSDGMTLYYMVHTWSGSPWGQLMQIYKSTDKGQTYTQIIETSVGYQSEEMDLWKPYDSDQMFVIDNVAKEYYEITHNFGTGNASFSSPVSFSSQGIANGGIHVSGRWNTSLSDYELFICHDDNDNVYKTSNGSSWTYLSTASDNVWRRGWLADPDNDNLYVGSFQLNKTSDLTNWEAQYTNWWEYYGSSKDSMHVDIMSLDYFEESDGTPFITICNHAGIHITYDNFKTTENLAWTSLNVTTLYDQSTASDGFLYCGAQDKGTFVYDGNSQANFNQISTFNTTTGDGMIGSFFNSDQSYYSMIQNGQFAVVPDRSTNSKSWYTIPGDNKSGWINPMVSTVNFSDNKAYMAGGNLLGGTGCYLIEMDVNISSGVTFLPSQFNYDFRANSNSGADVIKAIGVANSDEDRIYVATEDATFFYTENGGSSWTKSAVSLPSTMIPWEIISSNTNADKVVISGTGFSNTGVYLSTDGGDSFSALSTDIPSATFYEIIFDDSEQFLYAATSEGPYVYSFNDSKWYDLIGAGTPLLDFTTVDNIGNSTIRFGTYGRGVWDFEIASAVLPAELSAFNATLYRSGQVQVDWKTASEINTKNFEIQHGRDERSFQTIGVVVAKGSDQSLSEYKYLHENVPLGENYYRLKINDENSTFAYSDIRVVVIDDKPAAFTLFPNPIAQHSSLTVQSDFQGVNLLEIFDGTGRLMQTEQVVNGLTTFPIDLAKGVYWFKLSDESGQGSKVERVVVF